MNSSQTHLTDTGVAFTVYVDYIARDCLISADALETLSGAGKENADWMKTFEAYEANINGIARRMVAAGVQGPVKIEARNLQKTERRRVQ